MMVKELELIEKLRDMNLGMQLSGDCIRCGVLTLTSDVLGLSEINRGMMLKYSNL